jgi:soluble P-type ATPase
VSENRSNLQEPAHNFHQEKEFLICIDSDGTVFNTQEEKFKDYVIPCIINSFGLEDFSEYVWETAEFVNLYSRWRGIGRYHALLKVFELLGQRADIIKIGFQAPDLFALRKWIEEEPDMSISSLLEAVENTRDIILAKTLVWSQTIFKYGIARPQPAKKFPFVYESLLKASKVADIVVVSSETGKVLEKEWMESGMHIFTRLVAGNEMGKKGSIIMNMKGKRYINPKVMMIGDAPGDMEAAKANNVLFYPITPGREAGSWEMFHREVLDMFLSGKYEGAYEDNMIAGFVSELAEIPPWNIR